MNVVLKIIQCIKALRADTHLQDMTGLNGTPFPIEQLLHSFIYSRVLMVRGEEAVFRSGSLCVCTVWSSWRQVEQVQSRAGKVLHYFLCPAEIQRAGDVLQKGQRAADASLGGADKPLLLPHCDAVHSQSGALEGHQQFLRLCSSFRAFSVNLVSDGITADSPRCWFP